MKIKTLSDVRKWRLCMGCGACKAVCPQKAVTLHNYEDEGIRPVVDEELCKLCGACIETCPGIRNHAHHDADKRKEYAYFGPYLNIYEAYATDDIIRYQGSSGGVATALAFYCLKAGISESVINTGPNKNDPCINESQMCTSYDNLVASTGSRYSPASPCELIDKTRGRNKPSVFIGKPCDISAVRNAQSHTEEYKKSVFPLISIFCAGTPATKGIRNYLKERNVNSNEIEDVRFRGSGWPGNLSFLNKKNHERITLEPYEKVWDYVQRYRPLRCYLCADGTGETADISCGDAWHLDVKTSQPGVSLIITRTKMGQKIVEEACKSGVVNIKPSNLSNVIRAQRGLLSRKQELFGRYLFLKLFGIPVPLYKGWQLAYLWGTSSPTSIFRSIASTLKRILIRKLYKPEDVIQG